MKNLFSKGFFVFLIRIRLFIITNSISHRYSSFRSLSVNFLFRKKLFVFTSDWQGKRAAIGLIIFLKTFKAFSLKSQNTRSILVISFSKIWSFKIDIYTPVEIYCTHFFCYEIIMVSYSISHFVRSNYLNFQILELMYRYE